MHLLALAMLCAAPCLAGSDPHHQRACRIVDLDSCAGIARVAIPSFFRSGDTIVIMQTQSIDARLTGALEWNVVDTLIGSALHLRYVLQGRYDPQGELQVIKAITTPSRDALSAITVSPWNGQHGGVLAVISRDTLVLDGSISASGVGYRGGVQLYNARDTAEEQISTTTEGIVPSRNGLARNGGGHGGSHVARGGRGGLTTDAFPIVDVQTSTDVIETRDTSRCRAFMGSGGGYGHQNDLRGGRGGNGGGVVILSAPAIVATQRASIDASGSDGGDAQQDGAGGGGSGGTIMLLADTIIGALRCDVSGGIGGSTRGTIFRYGPGGGGSGGLLHAARYGLLNAIRLQRVGGGEGRALREDGLPPVTHNAMPGEEGVIRTHPWKLLHSRSEYTARTLIARDTTIDGVVHTRITTLHGIPLRWYTDGQPIGGSSELLIPPYARVRLVEADVLLNGCIARISVDLPQQPNNDDGIRISMDNVRADAGDTVALFVRIERITSRATLRGTVYLRLYQPVVLPLKERDRRRSRHATVELPFTLASDAQRTFRRVEAIALLGDSSSVQLSIDSVAISPGATTVELQHGRLTLNDICDTQGSRLFDHATAFVIQGREVRIRGDDAVITDVTGRVLCRLQLDTSGWMKGTVPQTFRGMCFVTVTTHGRVHTRTVLVGD